MNPTQLDDQNKNKSAGNGGIRRWLDQRAINRTLGAWHRSQRKAARRNQMAAVLETMPYVGIIGDGLYMIGFWTEYFLICCARKARRVAYGIGSNVLDLLLIILRPLVLGIITLLEDLAAPFVQMASGLRRMRQLAEEPPEDDLHAERMRVFTTGVRTYAPLVWTAFSYLLPVAAGVVFIGVVNRALSGQYILDVQVNGVSVGYVANEQVFDNARDDVQSRVSTAKALLAEAGTEVPDTQWDIQPTFTLAISGHTMTESQMADAILRASSDEIGSGTAVYIDDRLRFVTDQGDHLRAFLEAVKQPYVDGLDASRRVSFVHSIRLVDGVYLLGSFSSYEDILSALRYDGEILTYTAVEGETVQSAINATGVNFDSLAQMNPELLTLDQEIPAGTELITGVSAPELLQVKVVERTTRAEEVPFETVTVESADYDFGKRVVTQEGVPGQQEITEDYVYVDGNLTDVSTVYINVTVPAVPKVVTVGTRLKTGMVAQTGSGSFVWPVPQYTYVSRWMSAGHRGADICAPYGVPIIASDAGVVVTAGWHYSYGNYVVIDHGNGWRTLYAHMSSIAVVQGQGVAQSQTIGYVGSTGNSTGNHCHFEMYRNGVLYSAYNFFAGL
ncbi:MAG: peptidoglycan DD-metalloendopeptidase family protein [Gemmiger sp.]